MCDITGKRTRKVEIEFLVDETWKKASEINRESIDDFECSSSKHIMGYKRENEQIKYLVKGIKPHDTKIISSGVLSHFRPELIIHFLQDHIDWTRITFDSASFDGKRISCVRPGPCKPEQIVYATKVTGTLTYFIEIEGGKLKFTDAETCENKWPEIIINYLENFLN